jgi:hypothetical protein
MFSTAKVARRLAVCRSGGHSARGAPRKAISTGNVFSGLHHSLIFRLPHALGLQAVSPRIARWVTHLGMWYRYMSDLGN